MTATVAKRCRPGGRAGTSRTRRRTSRRPSPRGAGLTDVATAASALPEAHAVPSDAAIAAAAGAAIAHTETSQSAGEPAALRRLHLVATRRRREEDKGAARPGGASSSVWTAVGGILLAGVVVYLLNVLSVPVGIVIWTTVLVFCLRGPVNWLEKKGVSRALSAPRLPTVLLVVVLGAILLLMFSPAVRPGRAVLRPASKTSLSTCRTSSDWGNGLYAQYSPRASRTRPSHQWITDAQASLLSWASSLAQGQRHGRGRRRLHGHQRRSWPSASPWWWPSGSSWSCRRSAASARRLVEPAAPGRPAHAARDVHARHGRLHQGNASLQCAIIGAGLRASCSAWWASRTTRPWAASPAS